MNAKLYAELQQTQKDINLLKEKELTTRGMIQQLESQREPLRKEIEAELPKQKDLNPVLYELASNYFNDMSDENATKLFKYIQEIIDKAKQKQAVKM